jgi:hypothetical protein
MVRDPGTDKDRRELFARLAEHHRVLAEHAALAISLREAEDRTA